MITINLHFFNDESAENIIKQENTVKSENETNSIISNVENNENNTYSDERLEKLINLRVEKETEQQSKKILELQRKLEKLTKQNLSLEEIKQMEIAEKEKTLLEKEKELSEKENRLYAIKAIKSIGLDDGTDTSLSLIDFVIDTDASKIDEKVKSFNDLVNKFVASRVNETFKANGRLPNSHIADGAETEKKINVAEKLGKVSAKRNKESNDILNFYLGGVK